MADAIITKDPENVKEVFSFGYAKLFDQQWPMWVGGLLLGVLNVFMFAFEKAWSVADGVRNWGNWFFNTINVLEITIIDPHLYSTSLLNFGIIVGALASALLAKQFQVRNASTRELSKALIGGTLMGVGASLSFGCNIGGFFSAISALSMSGVTMMAGLMIGSFIGLKLLVWEITYLSPSASPVRKDVLGKQKKNQPLLGIIILLVGISLAFVYDELDYSIRGGFLMFGLMIGIIMQRTRFCFVRAFREPFMTGDGGASKAVVLAVIFSVVGFSILWRAGEGHIKLWVSLIAFALSSSYFREWLGVSGWSMKLGEALFIPELIGWKMGILSVCLLMLVWYLIVSWNEATRKLVIV